MFKRFGSMDFTALGMGGGSISSWKESSLYTESLSPSSTYSSILHELEKQNTFLIFLIALCLGSLFLFPTVELALASTLNAFNKGKEA